MFLKGTLNWWVLFVVVILGAAAVIAGFKGDLTRSEAAVNLTVDEAPTSLIFEVEPNDGFAQAGAAMPIITSSTDIMGAIASSLDVDYFEFSVSAQTVVNFEIFDGGGTDCSSGTMPAATTLTIYNNGGTQLVTDTASSGIGTCASINYPLAPGTYYVKVAKLTSGSVPQYILKLHYLFDGGSETEPNDTLALANSLAATPEQFVLGDHQLSTDTDFYQITLSSTNSLRLETVEGDNTETCESSGIFSTITLFNAGGTVLGSDSASGRGFCSQVDGRGGAPVNAFAHNLSPGVYYVSVKAATGCSGTLCLFNYRLVVQTDVPLMPFATATNTSTPTVTSTSTATLTPTNTATNTSTPTPTPISPPTVTTNNATLMTGTTAQLNGSANPKGDSTTGWFRYSTSSPGVCNDTFGTRAPASGGSSLGSGNSPTAYSQGITGLSPSTLYFFCAIANNSAGTSFGAVFPFVTGFASAPTVTTTGTSGNPPQLGGSANPNGDPTTGWFRYSTSNPGTCNDTFGTRAPASGGTSLGSGNSPVAYGLVVSGLNSGTTYFFCAIAQNGVGTSFGSVLSFMTPAATPSLGNYPTTSIPLSTDSMVTPDAAPTNTTRLSVFSSTNFKGILDGDPVTGAIRVTDAHPAGTYTVTVNAFGTDGTATKTFTLTVTTPVTCSPIGFATPVNSIANNYPVSIAIGDLNGDGKQDLITANDFSQNVSVELGDGMGGITSVTDFAAGANPSSLAVGDFNGDGKQDVAVANANSDSISFLAGNGSGGLAAPINVAAGIGLTSIAVGDLNGDGKQDLVVANASTDSASVVLGNGAGGFPPVASFPVGTDPKSVAIGDFNADGKQDLVVANYSSDNVSILLGDGMGNFGAATNYPVAGGTTSPASVAIGDLNDDGKQDLAVANQFSGVSVFLGDGMGNFGAATNFSAGNQPYSIALGDFNNDGEQDVVLGKQGSFANVTVLLGNGTGSLSGTQFFTTASVPWAVAVGDFNGDGRQDIVSANHDSFNISILLSTCGVSTPTSTATNTPTATPTGSGTPSIGGTVTYGNASAPPKYISNVAVTGTGSPNVFTTTAAPGGTAGQYSLTGFGAGSYTVSLSKTTGQNSITSNDAARIAQHVSGNLLLTTNNQKVAADVTGNGAISSQDAAKIAQVVAGLPFSPPNLTGTWKFFLPPGPTFPIGSSPTSRTYPSVAGNIIGDDYVGLLIGEVTGNWVPSSARPVRSVGSRPLAESGGLETGGGPERGVAVELPQLVSPVEKEIVVPVNVQGVANEGVISYEFNLRYDPSVIQPLAEPVDMAGTASRGLSVVANAKEPGLLRVVVYGALPIDKDGVLLNLKFIAVGKAGSVSPLTLEHFMFNEGEPGVNATGGQVELF